MKTELILVGKTTNKHFVACINDYVERIGHYMPFSITTIPELKNAKSLSEDQQKECEGELIMKQLQASDYLKRDSLQINEHEDLFLYASVSKTLRSTDSGRSGSSGGHSSSHFSSSGVSHGGHSGKF